MSCSRLQIQFPWLSCDHSRATQTVAKSCGSARRGRVACRFRRSGPRSPGDPFDQHCPHPVTSHLLTLWTALPFVSYKTTQVLTSPTTSTATHRSGRPGIMAQRSVFEGPAPRARDQGATPRTDGAWIPLQFHRSSSDSCHPQHDHDTAPNSTTSTRQSRR